MRSLLVVGCALLLGCAHVGTPVEGSCDRGSKKLEQDSAALILMQLQQDALLRQQILLMAPSPLAQPAPPEVIIIP